MLAWPWVRPCWQNTAHLAWPWVRPCWQNIAHLALPWVRPCWQNTAHLAWPWVRPCWPDHELDHVGKTLHIWPSYWLLSFLIADRIVTLGFLQVVTIMMFLAVVWMNLWRTWWPASLEVLLQLSNDAKSLVFQHILPFFKSKAWTINLNPKEGIGNSSGIDVVNFCLQDFLCW